MKKMFICLSLLALAFIWGNSLMDAPHSGKESRYILYLIRSFAGANILSEHILRKLAHFFEFMTFGACVMAALRAGRVTKGWLWACALTLLAAAADETMQLASPGRTSQLSDVALDTCGAWLGIILAAAIAAVVRFIKQKSSSTPK